MFARLTLVLALVAWCVFAVGQTREDGARAEHTAGLALR